MKSDALEVSIEYQPDPEAADRLLAAFELVFPDSLNQSEWSPDPVE